MDDLNGVLNPQLQGILSGAFAGMQAAGPSRMPTSLGQVIGAGGQAGLSGYNSALNAQRQYGQTQSLIDLQKQQTAMEAQKLKQLQDQYELGQRILKGSMPGLFPDAAAPGGALSGATSGTPGALAGAMGGIGPIPNQTVGGDSGVAPIPSGAGTTNIQPQKGLSGLSPDAALALQLIGGPAGEVGKSVLGLKKITALRPGAPGVDALGNVVTPPTPIMAPGMQFDMNTRTASPVPGYAQGAAGIAGTVTGAEAAAKAPYEFQNALVNGKEVPVSRATLAGNQPWQVPPDVQAQRDKDALRIKQDELASATNPTQRALLQREMGADPWQNVPKVMVPKGIGQTDYEKGVQGAAADQVKKLSEKFGNQSDQANTRIALNQQALSLVDQADTGPYAARIADVKNLLVSRFGLPESDFANTPTATVSLQKDLVNAATQKAKSQFGSRITQSEVQLMLQKASPNVDMPKAAIRYLINTDNAQAQYQIKQATDFGKYVSNGGDPLQFESWYSSNFPMAKAVGDVHITTPPKNYTDADINHTAMKYNMSPDEVKKRLGLQ